MMSELSGLVSGDQIVAWLVIALLFFYFVYKEWPEFKRWVTSGAKKESQDEQRDKQVNERLAAIEKRLDSFDEKFSRDFERLNNIEREVTHNQKADRDSLEEREIMMRSLLAIIEGLQEIGANGPTRAAQAEIKDYLNRKAHSSGGE